MRDQTNRATKATRPPLAVPGAEELALFLDIFSDCYMADESPPSPEAQTSEGARKHTPAGLKTAIRDCLQMSSHWTSEKVAEADAILYAGGAITLTELRRRFVEKTA